MTPAARQTPARKRRVLMVGLRGFPGVQGGVEAHAENLCVGLAQRGWDVTVAVRSTYMRHSDAPSWRGVKYLRIWAPRAKALETLVHSLFAVLAAAISRPDIVHIQAIGPALWTPIARFAGLRVIVTHHGPHYEWEKWSPLAKAMLRIGEVLGMRFANGRIAISDGIRELIFSKFGLPATRIRNGVRLPEPSVSEEALRRFGIGKGKYFLLVGRLVAEKRHLDLIEAFARTGLSGWKVVLVGDVDHPDPYSQELRRIAQSSPSVVLTGFQTGEALSQLYTHAGAFVLPSSHEGLSIALLEALGHGLHVLASDIPGNREIGLSEESYFPCGDIETLARKMLALSHSPPTALERQRMRDYVASEFSWDRAVDETVAVYLAALG